MNRKYRSSTFTPPAFWTNSDRFHQKLALALVFTFIFFQLVQMVFGQVAFYQLLSCFNWSPMSPWFSGPIGFIQKLNTLFFYPLVHLGFFEVLFQSLMFLWLGPELRREMGVRAYFGLIFVAWIFPVISAQLFNFIPVVLTSLPFQLAVANLHGTHFLMIALSMAYAHYFPFRQFSLFLFIPIEARYFAWFLVAAEIWMGMQQQGSGGSVGHALIGLSTALTIVFLLNRGLLGRFSLDAAFSQLRRPSKKRSHLRLVDQNKDFDRKTPDKNSPSDPRFWQ